ncbi:hypothetical protein UFOVP1290_539 [uncultured Caudovirales phage]|uniref:Uncharacterized protein n=1 Tax=uncultured Caudovirales phage TaxID=2100421 RepID=A0A6J5RJ36_9CAUD|nr:hypothetical protein UFOVP1290_539 [uncultured Caudovirales phage]
MLIDDEYDNIDFNKEIENISLNLERVKKNIPSFSSEKLCEMIACERYFGFQPEIAVMCMEELSLRRINGDVFEFENYIESSLDQLPKIESKLPDIQSIIKNIGQSFKK